MDANLQEFTVISSFLQKVLDIMEKAQVTDAQSKLAEKLLKTYKSHGELEFRVLKQEYAKEIIDKLTLHNVPCMWTKNRNGDYTLILPPDKKYGNDYGKYIEEVLMHYPEYYKQLSKKTWTHLAKVDEVKNVIGFTFSSQLEAEVFKNKAFADGHGIITTDIAKDGKITVYCRESDLMVDGNHKDAISALIDTEYSLDNSISHFGRCYAVFHDIKQADRCMALVEQGESFVIHNGASKESDYIQYEDDTLTFYKWDSELRKFEGREIAVGTKGEELRKLFEYHVSRIHNEQIDTIEEFSYRYSVLNDMPSEDILKRNYIEKQKILYNEILLPTMEKFSEEGITPTTQDMLRQITNEETQKLMRECGVEDVRPAFSLDFLKSIEEDIHQEIEDYKQQRKRLDSYKEGMLVRESDFKENLIKNRMPVVGLKKRVNVKEATLAEILQGLQEQNQFLESKLHDICVSHLGKVPSSDGKLLVKAFLSKGIEVPNRDLAIELIKKPVLTQQETEQLNAIANESLFCLVKESNPEAERFYLARGIVQGKINEASALLEQETALMERKGESGLSLSEEQHRVEEALSKLQINATEIRRIIQNEEVRTGRIEELDKGCHNHLKKEKLSHPQYSAKDLLRSLKDYMEKQQEPIDKTEITIQSMKSFEKTVVAELQKDMALERDNEQEVELDDMMERI